MKVGNGKELWICKHSKNIYTTWEEAGLEEQDYLAEEEDDDVWYEYLSRNVDFKKLLKWAYNRTSFMEDFGTAIENATVDYAMDNISKVSIDEEGETK